MQSLVCGFVEFNIITKINHMEIIRRRVGTHADGVFVNCSPVVSKLDYDACSSFVVNGVVNFKGVYSGQIDLLIKHQRERSVVQCLLYLLDGREVSQNQLRKL